MTREECEYNGMLMRLYGINAGLRRSLRLAVSLLPKALQKDPHKIRSFHGGCGDGIDMLEACKLRISSVSGVDARQHDISILNGKVFLNLALAVQALDQNPAAACFSKVERGVILASVVEGAVALSDCKVAGGSFHAECKNIHEAVAVDADRYDIVLLNLSVHQMVGSTAIRPRW